MGRNLSDADVEPWLAAYGQAWVAGDADAVTRLFTTDAVYRETPFDAVMRGRDAIRQYWQDGAGDAQRDVKFAAQAWAIDGDRAIAGWQAAFVRVPSGVSVTLDGVFRLRFERVGDQWLCAELLEWWHRQEATPG